jgi:hypothetical protein
MLSAAMATLHHAEFSELTCHRHEQFGGIRQARRGKIIRVNGDFPDQPMDSFERCALVAADISGRETSARNAMNLPDYQHDMPYDFPPWRTPVPAAVRTLMASPGGIERVSQYLLIKAVLRSRLFYWRRQMHERKKPVPVRLIYDVWLDDGERTPAGTVVSLSLGDAKALIANGKAERADPLPGE